LGKVSSRSSQWRRRQAGEGAPCAQHTVWSATRLHQKPGRGQVI